MINHASSHNSVPTVQFQSMVKQFELSRTLDTHWSQWKTVLYEK